MFNARMLAPALLLVSFLLADPGSAVAAHANLGGGAAKTGGSVTTASAQALEKGQWVVDAQIDFLKFDTFSSEELEGFAARDEEVHNLDWVTTFAFGVSFGVTDDISVHLSLPYVYRNDIEESEPPDEVHRHGDAKGLGDVSAHVHHRFLRLEQHGLHASLLYGLKAPTGETDDDDDNGERFEAEFQPGSGSWDPSLGLAVSKELGKLSVHGDVNYTLVTEGTQDTDLGDRFGYNLAAVYQPPTGFRSDLILELNGLWQDREEVNGMRDRDSGGTVVLISPGVRVGFGNWCSSYVSVGFPVLQDLNGEQNEIDYRLLAGINSAF